MREIRWADPIEMNQVGAVRNWFRLTPTEFGRLLGVSPQAVNQWENGKAEPKAFFLLALQVLRAFIGVKFKPYWAEAQDQVRKLVHLGKHFSRSVGWLNRPEAEFVTFLADTMQHVERVEAQERRATSTDEGKRQASQQAAEARAAGFAAAPKSRSLFGNPKKKAAAKKPTLAERAKAERAKRAAKKKASGKPARASAKGSRARGSK